MNDRTKKVAIYCANLNGGGAAVAAKLQCKNLSVVYDCKTFSFYESGWINRYTFWFNRVLDRLVHKSAFKKNPILHSSNMLPGLTVKELISWEPDVTFIHWVSNGAIHERFLKKLKGTKILVLHDSWWSCGFEHHPLNNIASTTCFDRFLLARKRKLLEMVDYVLSPSQWQLNSFVSVHPQFVYKSSVIRNFVPEVEKTISRFEGPMQLCVIGHNLLSDSHKGSEALKNLIEFISNHNLRIVVKIIGRCRYDIMDKYKQNSHVHFLGQLPHEATLVELTRSDLFINFSRLENYSYVNIEAQLCGCFLIAWDVGGNKETVVSEQTAHIIEWKDERKLQACIQRKLVTLSELRQTKQRRQQLANLFFSNKKIIDQTVELIRQHAS